MINNLKIKKRDNKIYTIALIQNLATPKTLSNEENYVTLIITRNGMTLTTQIESYQVSNLSIKILMIQ